MLSGPAAPEPICATAVAMVASGTRPGWGLDCTATMPLGDWLCPRESGTPGLPPVSWTEERLLVDIVQSSEMGGCALGAPPNIVPLGE